MTTGYNTTAETRGVKGGTAGGTATAGTTTVLGSFFLPVFSSPLRIALLSPFASSADHPPAIDCHFCRYWTSLSSSCVSCLHRKLRLGLFLSPFWLPVVAAAVVLLCCISAYPSKLSRIMMLSLSLPLSLRCLWCAYSLSSFLLLFPIFLG